MQEWTITEEIAGEDIAGVDSDGRNCRGWTLHEWTIREENAGMDFARVDNDGVLDSELQL